jgi:hypothetical protein
MTTWGRSFSLGYSCSPDSSRSLRLQQMTHFQERTDHRYLRRLRQHARDGEGLGICGAR